MSEAPHPFVAGPHLVIMGLMGVGKSTTGRALAERLGLPYVDSDRDLEVLIGRSGRRLAQDEGVPILHELEAAVLLGALAGETPSVISAASSTVESRLVRLVLARRAVVVRLDLEPSIAIARQAGGAHRRSMTAEELGSLAARREPLFAEVEDLRLDGRQTTEQLVGAIVVHLGSALDGSHDGAPDQALGPASDAVPGRSGFEPPSSRR